MVLFRIIPTLLLSEGALVKPTRFKNPSYIGDPINTAKIFNDLEVDELCVLDISASKQGSTPDFDVIEQLATECFMPLSYGGNVKDFETAARLYRLGVEKLSFNQACFHHPELITQVAKHFGSQAVIASVDIKKTWTGGYAVYDYKKKKARSDDIIKFLQALEARGAGEILLTAVDRENTWKGFDLDLLERIHKHISVPLIVQGGSGHPDHVAEVRERKLADAVALGSSVVYQGQGMGVLINFPFSEEFRLSN